MEKDLVKNNTCYLVTNELKKEILNYINKNKLLLNIHFFNYSEFINRCYFSYDIKSVYHLVKKFNLSYSNAQLFIKNIKYLMYSNKLNNPKYEYLNTLKNSLDDSHLLEYDFNFISFLNKYNIISDFDDSDPFINKINTLLNNKIKFIENPIKEDTIIYQYKDSESEIESIANKISDLLIKDIDPNKIHILNYSNEYENYINKIFTLYNIPFYLNKQTKLYDLKYVKNVFNDYYINNNLKLNEKYNDLNNQIIEIYNNISFIKDSDDFKECFKYLLKTINVKEDKYINIINFDSKIGYLMPEDYYFFIGLNNKSYPKYYKDEDYFTDLEKKELGYLTSYESNKILKQANINKLKSNSKINISYRLTDYFNKYMPSDIVNVVSNNIKKDEIGINKYSKEYNNLKLIRELDDYYKFNTKSEELINLLNILDKKDYKSYDNSFTGINKTNFINKVLKNQISISYSALQNFNECQFKYYLDNLFNTYTANYNTYIGNLCHHILEHIYESDFDFDKEANNFISDYNPSLVEKILTKNILKDFKDKVNVLLDQYKKTNYKNVKHETHISIYKKTNLSIKIHGFIDKIMLDDNNHALVVDYKTGEKKLTLDYLNYGLECQLPFYFYLLNKSKDYADVFLVGCYLQIINFKIKSYKDKGKELLLEGLTYNDEDIISQIDLFYKDNSFIKGIKPTKKNLGTYAKLFNSDLFNEIIDKMDININRMINDISNCDFKINPKILKDNSTTCKYCKYKDICYHNFNNYIDYRESGDDEDEMD